MVGGGKRQMWEWSGSCPTIGCTFQKKKTSTNKNHNNSNNKPCKALVDLQHVAGKNVRFLWRATSPLTPSLVLFNGKWEGLVSGLCCKGGNYHCFVWSCNSCLQFMLCPKPFIYYTNHSSLYLGVVNWRLKSLLPQSLNTNNPTYVRKARRCLLLLCINNTSCCAARLDCNSTVGWGCVQLPPFL